MQQRRAVVRRFAGEEEGVTLVEYALLLSLVALVIVTSLVYFSSQISTSYGNAVTPMGGSQKPGAGDPVQPR